MTTDEYYQFEFEKRTKEFRDSFLGIREQRYYLEQLNPFKYFIFARNKYIAHRIFEGTPINAAKLFCYYDPYAKITGSSDIASTVQDVSRILQEKSVAQCVIKSTEDSHGDNVIVVRSIEYSKDNCELILFDGQRVVLSDVIGHGPRIIEESIKQTSQFSGFNETSVNTIRFMTTLYPDGSARIIASFIKIGRQGRCVDNAGGGGNVDVCIDVESGEITHAIQFEGWRRITEIDKHPDNGAQLKGTVIEGWESIKAEVIKFQQAFPWCKASGWDVAITDDGPVVIEVNDMWDCTGQLFIQKGWRREIRDCYKAWQDAGVVMYRGRMENDYSNKKCKRLFGF